MGTKRKRATNRRLQSERASGPREPPKRDGSARYPGISPADDTLEDSGEEVDDWLARCIKWEAEASPGKWARYQPYLERNLEFWYGLGSSQYLYRPGDHKAVAREMDEPDGHGRPVPPGYPTRRVWFHPAMREVDVRTGASVAVRRTGPPRLSRTERWKHHILLSIFNKTLSAFWHRGTIESPAGATRTMGLIFTWFVVIMGSLFGSASVHLTEWVARKLWDFSPTIAIVCSSVTVFGGPDMFFPITLMNGSERFSRRIVCTIVFIALGIIRGWENAAKTLWLVSSVWHLDQGDEEYRYISWGVDRRWGEVGATERLSEKETRRMHSELSISTFRAAAGLGILIVKYLSFTPEAFYWGISIFLGANALFFFATGGHRLSQDGP